MHKTIPFPLISSLMFKRICKSGCSSIEDGQFINLCHDLCKSDINRRKFLVSLFCKKDDHYYYSSVDAPLQHDFIVSLVEGMYNFLRWHNTFHRKIWRRSLNFVVNEICKSVVPVWRRINRIANSIKTDPNRIKFGDDPQLYVVGENLCLTKLRNNSVLYFEVWYLEKNASWSKIMGWTSPIGPKLEAKEFVGLGRVDPSFVRD
ncbi:hypothetical protein H5410_048886 [Solanum commersonii]|uniref:Uncharacterized protein n=1 Tax=Solanum commersonii TaxID=4109 RepID=A0A9J5XMA1_SOLCO|nr:hypothetical protein H5410_048886 [Solanum commersonii]